MEVTSYHPKATKTLPLCRRKFTRFDGIRSFTVVHREKGGLTFTLKNKMVQIPTNTTELLVDKN